MITITLTMLFINNYNLLAVVRPALGKALQISLPSGLLSASRLKALPFPNTRMKDEKTQQIERINNKIFKKRY